MTAEQIIQQFSKPRFGVVHDDGRFEDLTRVRDYGAHPLADRARWIGGRQEAELVRAVLRLAGHGA